MYRQYKKAALRVANTVRAGLGLPPVSRLYPGKPMSAASCAITATVIDDDLDVSRYIVNTTGFHCIAFDKVSVEPVVKVRLDRDAREFTRRFDSGKYRDLVAGTLGSAPLSERVEQNRRAGLDKPTTLA